MRKVIVKKFTDDYFEKILLKSAPEPGRFRPPPGAWNRYAMEHWQEWREYLTDEELEQLSRDMAIMADDVSDEKLRNNLSRAKKRIFTLALCNPWDYWITLTLNKELVDRYGLGETYKKMAEFFSNYKRYNPFFLYLLVPEKHSDGAWHFHGFIRGIDERDLYTFTLQDKLPYRLLAAIRKGVLIKTWQPFVQRFGNTTFEPIKDRLRAAKYATKYITKDNARNVTEKGGHLYYASKGLQGSENIDERVVFFLMCEPDFENEYIQKKILHKYNLDYI